ncbi:hypothetical protein LSPH24S_00434 [Lysinibacillus sphaericus]
MKKWLIIMVAALITLVGCSAKETKKRKPVQKKKYQLYWTGHLIRISYGTLCSAKAWLF